MKHNNPRACSRRTILIFLFLIILPVFICALEDYNGCYSVYTFHFPHVAADSEFTDFTWGSSLGVGIMTGLPDVSHIGLSPYTTLTTECMFNLYGLYGEYGLELASAMFFMQDLDYLVFHHTVASTRMSLGYLLKPGDALGIGIGATLLAEGYLGYKLDEKYIYESSLMDNLDGHVYLIPSLSAAYNINPLLTLALGADLSMFMIPEDVNNASPYVFYPLDTEFYLKMIIDGKHTFELGYIYNPLVHTFDFSYLHTAENYDIYAMLLVAVTTGNFYPNEFGAEVRYRIRINETCRLGVNSGFRLIQYTADRPSLNCTLGFSLQFTFPGQSWETQANKLLGGTLCSQKASHVNYTAASGYEQFADDLADELAADSFDELLAYTQANTGDIEKGIWALCFFGNLFLCNYGGYDDLATEDAFAVLQDYVITGIPENVGVCFEISGYLSDFGNRLGLDNFDVYAAKCHYSAPYRCDAGSHFCNVVVTDKEIFLINYNLLHSTGTRDPEMALQMLNNMWGLPGTMVHTLYYKLNKIDHIAAVRTPDRKLIEETLTIQKGREPLQVADGFMGNMRKKFLPNGGETDE
jgi:hypothetical protein